ncbi:hypothetical protein QBC39DRAFT_437426 [Podospora conica]|nr:hypothetical protein QBC39DRAFT_437426 [Schizothecium conicum]
MASFADDTDLTALQSIHHITIDGKRQEGTWPDQRRSHPSRRGDEQGLLDLPAQQLAQHPRRRTAPTRPPAAQHHSKFLVRLDSAQAAPDGLMTRCTNHPPIYGTPIPWLATWNVHCYQFVEVSRPIPTPRQRAYVDSSWERYGRSRRSNSSSTVSRRGHCRSTRIGTVSLLLGGLSRIQSRGWKHADRMQEVPLHLRQDGYDGEVQLQQRATAPKDVTRRGEGAAYRFRLHQPTPSS